MLYLTEWNFLQGSFMNSKREVIIFSAMSLDGFIAKPNHDIKWLFDLPDQNGCDNCFKEFYKTIDTTIIGRKTYDQIIKGGDGQVYIDKKNYVFSHNMKGATEWVEFRNDDIVAFVKDLKKKPGERIWIVGGNPINSILLEHDLVDKIQLQVFPILLNHGIPLTSCNIEDIKLKLIKTEVFSGGVVDLLYAREDWTV